MNDKWLLWAVVFVISAITALWLSLLVSTDWVALAADAMTGLIEFVEAVGDAMVEDGK